MGVNLLNKGAMTVGKSQLISKEKPIIIAHAHSHQSGPTLAITHSSKASKGRPMTALSAS